jgi:predicted DNA-binding transcriptional regulator YafY
MPERPETKAARLVVLRELRQAGYLEGQTLQSIANVFDVNRSTILRDLRTLDAAETLLPETRQKWINSHPPIKSPQ